MTKEERLEKWIREHKRKWNAMQKIKRNYAEEKKRKNRAERNEHITTLFNQGYGQIQIGKITGLSSERVRQILLKLGNL